MRWWILALLLTSCGGSIRASRPGTLRARVRPTADAPLPSCEDLRAGDDGPRACAIARLDAEAGRIEVFVRIEPDALPVERAEVVLVEPGGSRVLGALLEAAEVEYQVELESSVAPGQSWRHALGWHLDGRSFVPEILVDGERVDVPATLLLEVGEEPLYTSAGPGSHLFDAPSFTRLADESYEIGALAMSQRQVDGVTLWIGAAGWAEGELEVAADAFADAFRRLQDDLGPAPIDSLLITLHEPEEAPFGRRAGSSVVWAMSPSTDPSLAVASELAPLTRLWVDADPEEPWLHQGAPTYLATRVGVAMLDLDDAALARAMLVRAQAEDPSGVLTSFCVDAQLREEDSSLASLLRGSGREPVSTEMLLESLAAISASSAGHLAALVGGDERFAIDACLAHVGYRTETQEGVLSPEDALREALGVTAWTANASLPVLRIDGVAETSGFEAGDHLLTIAGRAVATPSDVLWALRERPESGAVEARVRRRGEVLTVRLTMEDVATTEPAQRLELLSLDTAPTP